MCSLGGYLSWRIKREKWPQRGQFLPDFQTHSPVLGQKTVFSKSGKVKNRPVRPISSRRFPNPTASLAEVFVAGDFALLDAELDQVRVKPRPSQ